MKFLTVLSFLFFTNAAFAQTSLQLLPLKGWFPSYFRMQYRLKAADSTGQQAVSAEPGLYKMRQDGMPCIVPDTEGMPAMPNVFGPTRNKSKVKSQN